MLLVIIFLDQIKSDQAETEKEKLEAPSFWSTFLATFRHLKDKRQCLLIPLTMYSGFEQGFLSGDYTKVWMWMKICFCLIFLCHCVLLLHLSYIYLSNEDVFNRDLWIAKLLLTSTWMNSEWHLQTGEASSKYVSWNCLKKNAVESLTHQWRPRQRATGSNSSPCCK